MRIFSYFGLFVILAIGLTFAILNSSQVTLNYYVGELHLALSLLLVIVLGIGILCGILISLKSIVRLKSENSRLKTKNKQGSCTTHLKK